VIYVLSRYNPWDHCLLIPTFICGPIYQHRLFYLHRTSYLHPAVIPTSSSVPTLPGGVGGMEWVTLQTLEEGEDSPSKMGGSSGGADIGTLPNQAPRGSAAQSLSFKFAKADQSPPPSPSLRFLQPDELPLSSAVPPPNPALICPEGEGPWRPPPLKPKEVLPWSNLRHPLPSNGRGSGAIPSGGAAAAPRVSQGGTSATASLSGDSGGCCGMRSRFALGPFPAPVC